MGKKMENAGASAIAVHARTRSQKYTGRANWNWIAELKKHISIPVIGNGDVTQHEDIQKKFQETQVDGVMIGRGALGNPWIFSGHKPTIAEIYLTLLDHLENHLSFYPNKDLAYRTFRKHIVWYTKGLPYSAEFRDSAFKERDNQKLMEKIHLFFQGLNPKEVVKRDMVLDEDSLNE